MTTTRYYTLPDQPLPEGVRVITTYHGLGRPIVKIESTRRHLDRLEREKQLERRRIIT